MTESEKQAWLEIHDSEVTAEALMAEVERRVAQRRAELGVVQPVFPTFGFVSEYPEPPQDGRAYNPNLYHHLRQANQTAPPETAPVLAASPATRVPLLGRLWGLVRAQFHELILFYVNRPVRHGVQLNNHLISVLNELTRQVAAQQEEIESLRAELRALKEKRP